MQKCDNLINLCEQILHSALSQRSYNTFIDFEKLSIEYAAILYAAIWNRERAVAKRKAVLILRGSVLPKLLQKSTISYFLVEGIYRSVQTRIAKRWILK